MAKLTVLIVCLLALVATALGGYEEYKPKPDPKPVPAPKCLYKEEFKTCKPYVSKGGYHNYAPKFYSACCKYVRKETLECLCEAAKGKYYFQVDEVKVLALVRKCGKYIPKGKLVTCKPPPPPKEDPYKPPKKDDPYKPPKEDPYKPPKKDDPYKPPEKEDPYKPPKNVDPYKPPKKDDPYKPPEKEDSYKPPRKDDPSKPPNKKYSDPQKRLSDLQKRSP